MVKPGAVVIDVGMNRDDDGKLVRRRGFRERREVAGGDHAGAGRGRADDDRDAARNTVESAERAASARPYSVTL